MARPFSLYWTSLENFEACPRRFLWSRGWPTKDLGDGLGRRKLVPDPQPSRHHAVMGIVIQQVLENLYNDTLWKEPNGLEDRLIAMVQTVFQKELENPRNYVNWREASRADMLRTCEAGVRGYLRTMKANKLLGPYAVAELDLVASLDDPEASTEWLVGGKADVVFRRDDVGVTFLDGKNSQSKGKYTNPDQLRWYALMFLLVHGVMPDRLGFIYYRYPHGQAIPGSDATETGVDWVSFTRDDLDGLAERARVARRAMSREEFDPTPTPTTCKFCDYASVCPERQAQIESNRRPRKDTDALSAPTSIGTDSATGLTVFGL